MRLAIENWTKINKEARELCARENIDILAMDRALRNHAGYSITQTENEFKAQFGNREDWEKANAEVLEKARRIVNKHSKIVNAAYAHNPSWWYRGLASLDEIRQTANN